jgi:hypothetical protein
MNSGEGATPAISSKLSLNQLEHVRAHHLSMTIVVVEGTETLQIVYVDSCGDERCPLPLRINMYRCHAVPCPRIEVEPPREPQPDGR